MLFRSREALTSLLGFEWRAVVEHFFASVGIPLVSAIAFVVMWLGLEWGRYGIANKFGWRVRWLSRHPHDVVPESAAAIVAAALGLAYIAASLLFELYQAECSVYGTPARGYLQGWQFFADAAGACLSFAFAAIYGRRRQNVAQPCGQPDLER